MAEEIPDTHIHLWGKQLKVNPSKPKWWERLKARIKKYARL
jgi:hypothetical protein